jgi:hypothetical protein
MAKMYKVGAWFLLLILMGKALADWQLVGANEASYLFADRSTIRKEDSRARMTNLIDFRERQYENEHFFQSISVEVEYDCKADQFRELSLTRHVYRMSDGEATPLATPPGIWEPIPPGSGTRLLADIACGKERQAKAHKKKAKNAVKYPAPK